MLQIREYILTALLIRSPCLSVSILYLTHPLPALLSLVSPPSALPLPLPSRSTLPALFAPPPQVPDACAFGSRQGVLYCKCENPLYWRSDDGGDRAGHLMLLITRTLRSLLNVRRPAPPRPRASQNILRWPAW